MRMRLFGTIVGVLIVGLLAGPATSTAAPTLTLTRDCSAYPPFHEFAFSLSGLPPNTPFFPTLSYDGTTIGPATGFSTDAAGNYMLAGLGSSKPATFTLTIDWAGGTLVQSLYVNCALPTSRHDCENGGWSNFPVFKNQGDCVSFVATGGKNPPANSP
jgi:hypothetical protein